MTTTASEPETLGRHHIEEIATVYLKLSRDGQSWEVDSPSNDGYPLESYPDGALHDECECREDTEDGDVVDVPLGDLPSRPTLPELHKMIGDYLS